MVFSLVAPAVPFLQLALVASIHFVIRQRLHAYNALQFSDVGYLRALIALYLFGFTSFIEQPLEYTDCRRAGPTANVVFSESALACDSHYRRTILPVLITLLLTHTALVMMLAVLLRRSMASQSKRSGVWLVLTEGFRLERYYWGLTILGRRILISVISVFSRGFPGPRFFWFGLLHFSLALVHQIQAPYANKTMNRLELASLLGLQLLSMLLLFAQADPLSSGLVHGLALFVILAFALAFAASLWSSTNIRQALSRRLGFAPLANASRIEMKSSASVHVQSADAIDNASSGRSQADAAAYQLLRDSD